MQTSQKPGSGIHYMEKTFDRASTHEHIMGGDGCTLPLNMDPNVTRQDMRQEKRRSATEVPKSGSHFTGLTYMEKRFDNTPRERVMGGDGCTLPLNMDPNVTPQDMRQEKKRSATNMPSSGGSFTKTGYTERRSATMGSSEHIMGGPGTTLPLNMDPNVTPQDVRPEKRRGFTGIVDQPQKPEDQDMKGPDLKRLPSYEVENTHQANTTGMRKASFNLDRRGSQDKIEEKQEDDSDFTTGLMSGPTPFAAKENQKVNKEAPKVSGDEKHKNYEKKQQVDKENVGKTYLI